MLYRIFGEMLIDHDNEERSGAKYGRPGIVNLDPYRMMFLAHMQFALFDLGGKHERDRHEAQWWIVRTDQDGYVFSFENTCNALGLDPSYIRKRIAKKFKLKDVTEPPAPDGRVHNGGRRKEKPLRKGRKTKYELLQTQRRRDAFFRGRKNREARSGKPPAEADQPTAASAR